jgi:N-methylhydantoinase B
VRDYLPATQVEPRVQGERGLTGDPLSFSRIGMSIPVDPIVVSVIQHRLLAIVEEMGEAMLRTSYSQILNSSRDFSTAICDMEGRLVAQAEHVPIHVGALPYAARAVTEFFGDDIHTGDVFLLNDPYHGGNHLPDLTAFVPVFQGDRPRFWSINRAHQSDIGGATHGAYNAAATDIWQEGIRITPLRLYDRGEVRRDLLQMIATNVRHPRDFQGDLAAMIGSAHVGERRLLALAHEFGWGVADAAIEAVLDGAERQTRAVIAQWQDGVYRGEALLDDDGRGNQDIHIRATVTKKGSDLRIDLSDSHEQVRSFVNSSLANMYSSVVVALSYLIDPHTPKNDGTFRPIEVIAKPGTIVWANEGAPVTLATNHCGQEIIEAIIKAVAPACPDRAMAGWGRRFRIAIQGRDPRTDKPFIWHFFQARPGGGGSPAGDGWPGGGEWQAAGGIKFGSLEVTEVRFPLFFRRHEFRPDSGGAGKYRGGPGGVVEMVVEIEEPALGNTAGDGVRHGACGILGGDDGLPHHYVLHSAGRPPREVRTKEVGLEIRPGDVLILESGGGGGWGDPALRDPAAHGEDVENGFVTNAASSPPPQAGEGQGGGIRPGRANMRGGFALSRRARRLRTNLTDAEQVLWRELRRYRLGWRFRRQFPIPPYVVDFACLETRLIVEVDGGQQARPGDHDPRDAVLRRQGWRVLRFWNSEVLANNSGVLQTILEALGAPPEQSPHPNPPPQAGEGAAVERN